LKYRIKDAEVSCETPEECHVDGDANGRINEAVVKIYPKSLKIVIP
jgi:hypothetical protein